MVDLATMRMRESIEPLGDRMPDLFRHYEACVGEPIDDAVVEFHTLQFATLGAMQFTGTVGRPTPGDPHAVYLEFDLALRQVMLQSMSLLTGLALVVPEPLPARTGPNASTLAKLADTVARIEPATPLDVSRKDAADQLIEWLSRADDQGAEATRRDLADVSALLDREFNDWPAAELALEAHVLAAGPEQDTKLFQLFGAIEARRMQMFGPTRIGQSAVNVHSPAIR
jgi:hypothetical protein